MSDINKDHGEIVRTEKLCSTEDGLLEKKTETDHQKLSESNRRLTEGALPRSCYLANLNQELHTSLNLVIGFSNVLLDRMYGPLNEKQQQYVENIIISGKRLLDLFNDYKHISKIEPEKNEL